MICYATKFSESMKFSLKLMIITNQRQEIICWQCNEQFSRPLPQQNVDHLITNYPYCGAECVVDFKPYSTKKSVFRQGDSELNIHGKYDLPKIIRSNKVV
jgi:hypothetical protein